MLERPPAGRSEAPSGFTPPRAGRHTPALVIPVLAVCLLAAAALRIGLARYSLWYDELASVFFASQPLGRLWSGWMVRETNPPLYYTLLHVWARAFGFGELSLRLPSILASLAVIAVSCKGVADTFGAKAGAVAAVLLTLSAQQLFFSHEVRAYIFLYLAIAVSFFGLLRVLREPGPCLPGWIAHALGSIAAIYLHTTGALWPAAATVALVVVDRRFRPLAGNRWLSLALADLLIGLGGSWWFFITVQQLLASGANLAWIPKPGLSEIPTLVVSSMLLTRHPSTLIKVLLVGLAALSVWGAIRTWPRRETRFTVTCLALSTLLFLVLQVKQPVLIDRTLFWLTIFPVVLVSVGLAALGTVPFRIALAAVVALLGLNLYSEARRLPVEDWATPAKVLATTPQAVLVVDSESMNLAMTMACRVELKLPLCPFPIVALGRPGDGMDAWAQGSMDSLNLPVLAPATLPADAHVYLMRRIYHDVLKDLQHLGLVKPTGTEPLFAGPFPASILTDLQTRGAWQGRHLQLNEAVPLR